MLSINSYGESLVCYYIHKGVVGEKTYKRDGDKYMDRHYPMDIVIDNSEVLLLQEVFSDLIFHFMLDKKTKEARFTSMSVDYLVSDIGECKVIN